VLGAQVFAWSPNGNLLSDNGPWFNDTVTYTYLDDPAKPFPSSNPMRRHGR
jgi:hypothetical protein